MVRRFTSPVPPDFEIIARAKKLDQRIVDADIQAEGLADTRAVVRIVSRYEIDRIVDEVNL
jgi:hypothetical protein